MDTQNNSHLIAGFFRYHREKLNYSLRGLVGDGSVVDLSSLSAFENCKRNLTESQLIWIFDKIGYNYINVLNLYSFNKEYSIIFNSILLGNTKFAESCFIECSNKGVFEGVGAINFSLLQYFLSCLNNNRIKDDGISDKLELYFDNNQLAFKKIADSILKRNQGDFSGAIEILRDSERITYHAKLRAFISQQFGIYYGLMGNYVEATISFLEAKRRFSDFLGIIQLIQVNLNLGTIYTLTNSFTKAEESYLEAYNSSLLLKESSYLMTKCFNSLCWLYFKMNDYSKVKEILYSKPNDLAENKNTYFILSWASYKLGINDQAIQYARLGQEKFKDNLYACVVYQYIENASLGKKTGQDVLLKKAIEMKDFEHTQMIDELFTYELIDIYERRKNYEKAFKYAKKLLNR